MFFVECELRSPIAKLVTGWFPTIELARLHANSWPDKISDKMFISEHESVIGGEPPEHMQAYVSRALDEYNVSVAVQARMVSHAEDAFRYKPTEPEMVADEWRPWDTAPRDGSYFDAWVEPIRRGEKARRIPHAQFCKTLNGFWAMEFGTTDEIEALGKPTHWRPEPEGPKK